MLLCKCDVKRWDPFSCKYAQAGFEIVCQICRKMHLQPSVSEYIQLVLTYRYTRTKYEA